jgi:hypothetical protein
MENQFLTLEDSLTSPIIVESLKDNPFNTGTTLFKDKLEDIKFWTSNWKSVLPERVSDMIKSVESINELAQNEITEINEISRVDTFAKIIFEYNEKVDHLKFITSEKDLEVNKKLLFELKRWIIDNQRVIFPEIKEYNKLGNLSEIPTKIELSDIIK